MASMLKARRLLCRLPTGVLLTALTPWVLAACEHSHIHMPH